MLNTLINWTIFNATSLVDIYLNTVGAMNILYPNFV